MKETNMVDLSVCMLSSFVWHKRSAKLMVVLRRELEMDKRQIRQYRLLKNVMNKVSSARQIDK